MGSATAFELSIRPRYGEVDSMGVVYHAHYLAYFDVGRTEYLRACGADYAELERRGFRLAVVDLAVRYLRGARFDDELRLAVLLTELGRASVRFEYELRRGAETLATGYTRLGCLDTRNRPTPLPADTLECLRGGPGSRPGKPVPRRDV
ncbi:MAG TPA: thioesterase family protein [Planctomycetota bacterium]|nr:thioesterase family protein [Planctomycetota bacterium]